MPFLVDKLVTAVALPMLRVLPVMLALTSWLLGQSANSIRNVHAIYVGSLGAGTGADELRRELIRHLVRRGNFKVVDSAAQSDGVLDGRGELWIRSYHSLSPRARVNTTSAEPSYDGFLSVKLHGKDEILWSYFADPRRVSFRELKEDLVSEVTSHLTRDRELGMMPTPSATLNDVSATLHGTGATFPYPIYVDWFKSFHGRQPAWTLTYTPTSSATGIEQLAAGKSDFAGSDIPPDALKGKIPAASDAFPTVGGAVVLVYNLPNANAELRVTPALIESIFSGRTQAWNDAAMVAVNPGFPLPPMAISTFHRSDGSGTTYALTEYLSRADAAQDGEASPDFQWTSGTGVNGNEGVASAVAATPYSLGYVEFIYAFNHHLSFASIRNASGRFVKADLLSIMAAANGAGDNEKHLSLSITNSPAVNAYPISTFSWLIAPRDMEPAKRKAFVAFLEWMITAGQRECSALGYAPLPTNLVDREISAIRKLK